MQEWIREVPGFLSATYHASTDGTAVVNYAQWESEQAYRVNFGADPRSAELREALSSLPGLMGPPRRVHDSAGGDPAVLTWSSAASPAPASRPAMMISRPSSNRRSESSEVIGPARWTRFGKLVAGSDFR